MAVKVKRVYKTDKGTEIPLIDLKGKEYLQVAHRLILLVESHENYQINTEFLNLTDTSAVVKAQILIIDKDGITIVKSATATKSETKAGFADFIEKAETGAIGRALALLGIGTQFCTQDMDEGDRLADAPLISPTELKSTPTQTGDSSNERPKFQRRSNNSI